MEEKKEMRQFCVSVYNIYTHKHIYKCVYESECACIGGFNR